MNCKETYRQKLIPLPDCGKTLMISNPKQRKVARVKFDQCLVKNETAVDYIVSVTDGVDLLVELKGKAVEHAIKQIDESITKVRNLEEKYDPKLGVIYCKQVPSGSISINKKKEAIFKKHGVKVSISSSSHTFCIEKYSFI